MFYVDSRAGPIYLPSVFHKYIAGIRSEWPGGCFVRSYAFLHLHQARWDCGDIAPYKTTGTERVDAGAGGGHWPIRSLPYQR